MNELSINIMKSARKARSTLWRRALKADIHAPSPHDNGWIIAANKQVHYFYFIYFTAKTLLNLLKSYTSKLDNEQQLM